MRDGRKTLLGIFVLGAMALSVVAIAVLGSGAMFAKTQEFVMFFDGSVSGLNVGAPVVFKGVRIGSVKDINLVLDPSDLSPTIPVLVELDPSKIGGIRRNVSLQENMKTLVERGLRAQLVTQSFVTGQLMISLDFFPDRPALYRGDGTVAEIPTIPTVMQQLARKLEDLPLEEMVNKIVQSVNGLEALINSPELRASLKAMERALEELGTLARNLNQEVGPLAKTLKNSIREYGTLARRADGYLANTTSEASKTLERFRKVAEELDSQLKAVSGPAQKALEATELAMVQARTTMDGAGHLLDENSPLIQRLTAALEEMALASRSLRSLAEYLERHPEAILYGKTTPKREVGR